MNLRRRRSFSLGIAVILIALALAAPAAAQEGPEAITFRQWASGATATSQFGDDSWSAMQATGAPDVSDCADHTDAWASATATGRDSLTLTYDVPVVPSEINIYQTYNPGAITSVELVLADGSGTVTIANSADPGVPCPGVLIVSALGVDAPVNGVIIHLDQTITGNWNEIDAVELVGQVAPGTEVALWANDASASSQYGNDGWSAEQATGAPDVAECGDNVAAWASATVEGQEELTVYFPYAVLPARLEIYQSYNPGAITGVEVILEDRSAVTIPDSAFSDSSLCPVTFSLPLSDEAAIIGAVLHLDMSLVGDWSEVDAVRVVGALVGEAVARQWASDASATSEFGSDSWSAEQATGAPDAVGCSDNPLAWASASSTGQDSLTVTFRRAVVPQEVNIYQNYNPGAITGIELALADGSGTVNVRGSADAGTPCPGIMTISLSGDVPPVNGVIIHLDQTITGNWNEIDAVELVGIPVE